MMATYRKKPVEIEATYEPAECLRFVVCPKCGEEARAMLGPYCMSCVVLLVLDDDERRRMQPAPEREEPKVYLAGGLYGDWRERIMARLPIEGFNPATDNDQTAAYRFVRDDLAAIEACDFVIAYYPGGYQSHGMIAEIGYAAGIRKPVIYIDETSAPDLFVVGLCKRFFRSIDAFFEWWERRDGRPIP